MHRTVVLMVVLLILTGCLQAAAISRCNSNDRIGDEILNANDWVKMQSFYLGWVDCDDGDVAEGISDRVGSLLAEKFTDFVVGANEKKLDDRFVTFVIKHIDASQDEDNLQSILKKSQSCTTKEVQICERLQIRAQTAIDDL